MGLESYYHVLNPNKKNRASVLKFFKSRPELQSVLIDRDSHPTHLETVVEWILREKYESIVVWGGDGTLSRALQAFYRFKALNKVTIGLVPVGTCNDFARVLKIHSWPRLQKTLDREPLVKPMDLGLMESERFKRVFINNAGFGRSAAALKRKKSRPIADILSFSPRHVDLEWENEEGRHFEALDVIMGIVFNGPYFSGGLHFSKHADPSDGVLDACFEPPQNSLKLLGKFLRSRWGFPLKDHHTLELGGRMFRLTSKEDFYPQADGERISDQGVKSLSFSLLPHAVKFALLG